MRRILGGNTISFVMSASCWRDVARATLAWHPPGVFELYYLKLPWITGTSHDNMIRLHLLSMSQDLDTLLDTSTREEWTPTSSVPPKLLGELWPFGEPVWLTDPWPDEAIYRGYML